MHITRRLRKNCLGFKAGDGGWGGMMIPGGLGSILNISAAAPCNGGLFEGPLALLSIVIGTWLVLSILSCDGLSSFSKGDIRGF